MKTLLLTLALSFNTHIKPDSVYLCMGSWSHAYHKITTCKGLRKCTTKLKKVSLYDATHKYKRTYCHYCYHN